MNLIKNRFFLLTSLFVILIWYNYNPISNFLRLYQNEFLQWQYSTFDDATTITYDRQGDIALKSTLFYPKQSSSSILHPTIVYLFGGSWKKGGINQFYEHAIYFRKKDYLTILVDYRVKMRHSSTPLESIKDVKSILDYLIKNSLELKVDTTNIYIIGASAGAQLALAASFYSFDSISRPSTKHIKGIILYSPVINSSTDGYYFEGLDTILARQLSPINNIIKNMPPTLIFHGEEDPLISLESVLKYQSLTQEVGNYSKVTILKNLAHNIPENQQFVNTLIECESFMKKNH